MDALTVAPCDLGAATYAVEHWHYSAQMPTGKLVKYGVWEGDTFVGAVLYGRGASPNLGRSVGLTTTEVCELVRVALRHHTAPVTRIVAATLRQLGTTNPGLRAVISFADPAEGHHGGIYQAGNWIYTGTSEKVIEYLIGGRWRHTRGAWHHPNRSTAPRRTQPGKHRYIYPLDKAMRRRLTPLALPYPPRGSSLDGETPAPPAGGPGSTPGNRSD